MYLYRPISELDILFVDLNNLFTTTFVSKVSLLNGFKGLKAANSQLDIEPLTLILCSAFYL